MRVVAFLKLLLLLPPPLLPPLLPPPISPSALRESKLAIDLITHLKTDLSFTLQLFTSKKEMKCGEKE